MNHLSGELVRRYARGDTAIPADQLWGLESHLEQCAECRRVLAAASDMTHLLDIVWTNIELVGPPPAKHKRIATWAAPAAWPWLGMTLVVTAMALVFDMATGAPLMLLLAPIAPVLGVAAAWSKGMDPAYEIVSATPRAGLYLVLRRTAAVLAVVVPVFLLAWLVVGASPGLWLLPSLAFTVGTLALGGAIGVSRAAWILGSAWAVFVVAPGVVAPGLPLVLQPVSLPVWALVVVGCGAVLAFRADAYTRLG
jgi:hypothetical protein